MHAAGKKNLCTYVDYLVPRPCFFLQGGGKVRGPGISCMRIHPIQVINIFSCTNHNKHYITIILRAESAALARDCFLLFLPLSLPTYWLDEKSYCYQSIMSYLLTISLA